MMSTATTTTTLPDIPDMPSFKPLRIPPPCPMQWQLSLDDSNWASDLHSTIDTTPFHSIPHATQIEVLKCQPFTPTMLEANERTLCVLNQFGEHNDYGSCYTALVNGFIRQLEDSISSLIPQDINKLCASFYYEEENQCVQIAYKLYHIIHQRPDSANGIICGTMLVSMIQTQLSNDVAPQTIDEVCNDLVKHGLFEVVSFETSFFSLFKEKKGSLFEASEHYKYQLTMDNIKAFETFSTP
eukprot:497639_1